MYLFYDQTYILVIIAILISTVAQHWVRSTFDKYKEWEIENSLTGEETAQQILDNHQLYDVKIEHTPGYLTDHYDPANKILRLSDATYNQKSISAVAVAAHECGHALQDAENYGFMKIRSALVPIVNFTSRLSMPLILLGLIMGWVGLMNIGIIAFSAVLVFQIVTLPVEFNASSRALTILDNYILQGEEVAPAKKVLRAAAFTYIAAALGTALQIIRFILMSRRRN